MPNKFIAFIFITLFIYFWFKIPEFKYKDFTCKDCHKEVTLDKNHESIDCTSCHTKENYSFQVWEKTCGNCHKELVESFKKTSHFGYKEIVFNVFKSILKVKILPFEVEDFLKRRCFLCHLDYEGEDYSNTRRGKGCGACHLQYEKGKIKTHQIKVPTDQNCLACHYSTYIGWDYYGFVPQSWYIDYRSPFIKGKDPERPWGIEANLIKPSIHKEKGLTCIFCHSKEELMLNKRKPSCRECHRELKKSFYHFPETLQRIRCEVCHTNFLNQDGLWECRLELEPDMEFWIDLRVQESSEIEKIFQNYLAGKPYRFGMKDKVSGEEKAGIWLCALHNRTFEKINLGKDKLNRICILRKFRVKILGAQKVWDLKFEKCVVPHSNNRGSLY